MKDEPEFDWLNPICGGCGKPSTHHPMAARAWQNAHKGEDAGHGTKPDLEAEATLRARGYLPAYADMPFWWYVIAELRVALKRSQGQVGAMRLGLALNPPPPGPFADFAKEWAKGAAVAGASEDDYVRIANLTRIRDATVILRGVLDGEAWGVPASEMADMRRVLRDWEDVLEDMTLGKEGTGGGG